MLSKAGGRLMTINFEKVGALRTHGQAYSYRDRETMLYALGVGMGGVPFDERELAFVYENGLKTMPTLATVAAWGAGDFASTGVNYLKVVHGEQRLTLHRPMPASCEILADWRISECV